MRKIQKTFYDWCIENNKQDILNRIDYNLTDIDIKSIGYGSRIHAIYLKCPKGIHASERFRIHNITNKYRNNKCECKECKDIFDLNFENLSLYCKNYNYSLFDIGYRQGTSNKYL